MNFGDAMRPFRCNQSYTICDRYAMSLRILKKCVFDSSALTSERENPVPTGSMNTRSVKSSHVSGLSTSWTDADGTSFSAPNGTCFGPIAPRFRYTDAAPGPPLNAKVTGLV